MISLFRYGELIRNLVLKDLKLKYRDSTLGFIWSLANPLLLLLVYSFVFTRLLRSDIPNFGFFLLVGILPWNFFAQSLTMSTGAVIDNANLIKKVWLPIEVFPITTVLFNLAQFLLALFVLLPAAVVYFKSSLTWSWLAFVPVVSLQVIFTLGLCFFFSTATVFYRDVKHFTEVLLLLLFWLTPVVYDLRAVPEPIRYVILINPFSFFVTAYQDILYLGVFPSIGGILAMLLLSFFSLGLGYLFFVTCKARFAEEI
jgi:lipopolysaccharide transport system permease protein